MKRAILILFGVCGFISSTAHAQLTPAEALKKFTVAEGLQVELFAAEPMLVNPTSIDVDHKGRVWVCEAVNYRISRKGKPLYRPEGDRIVVLEDTDGDGKADKSHVFYQAKDFIAPLGIAIAPYPLPASPSRKDPASPSRKGGEFGYRVFVCHHSEIVVFEDKDGDLKADGPPKKLLGGFGGFDTDHGLHGINIGPDGKLYFTVGDAGVKGVQSADGKGPKWTKNDTDCRAGTVWRCDMDGNHLELIAHNFRNHYECCVNSFGEIWTSDNDDDGSQQTRLCYVMPGGNYGYHPRGPGQSHWHEEQPGIVHKVLRTGFGSPSGMCFYEGTLLPKKYHGQILHCDAGPREFRCFHITPKGAGYEAEKEVLVSSSDNWFRLSDCCVAPDGSVMLADWYDPGVGGNGMGDWTRGRIYRVTPKGHKGYKAAEAKLETKKGLREVLRSPCLATRALAISKLLGMKWEDVFWTIGLPYLDETAVKQEKAMPIDEVLVARILSILAAFVDEKNPRSEFTYSCAMLLLRNNMKGVSLNFRLWNDWAKVGRQPKDKRSFFILDLLLDSENKLDIKPWLRDALCGFERSNPDLAGERFYKFAKFYDGKDHFYRAALNIACGTDPARRDAILSDFDKHFPEWNDRVADLVWELRPKSMMPRLVKLLDDPKLTGAQKARIVDILAGSDDADSGKSILALLGKNSVPEVRARAAENFKLFLPTKWKTLAGGPEFNAAVEQLLKTEGSQALGLQLIAAAEAIDLVDEVRRQFYKKENPAPVKAEAIRTLGQLRTPKAVEALKRIVECEAAFAGDAIDALGMQISASPKKENNTAALALPVLQDALLQEKAPLNLKLAALSALAGSFNGTKWLLDSHEEKKLPPELTTDAGKLLRYSPYQALRNRALAMFPTPGKLDPAKLPPIPELAKRIGDVERGKEIWASSFKGETQCMRCHTLHDRGGKIGPDLSLIGKKASKENLFESILLPSKAIADQFLQWKIETTAGQSILGLLVEDTPSAITIRDANGKDTKIAKPDIESRTKSPTSIMPEDLVKTLSEDDLIDLVAYLFTLK